MILGHCSQLQLKLVQRAISSANKFNFTMSESAQEEKWLWSFGYGSNMDVTALRAKKKVDIKDHAPAVLKDFRMAFTLKGIPWVEPAFANVEEKVGAEVHGVAFCMSQESMEKLDKVETGYIKKMVTLKSYDGRDLEGFVYTKETGREDMNPSARYLGVLCKGARQAGLNADYIARLSSHPVYQAPDCILAARSKTRVPHEALREVSLSELALHSSDDAEGGIWACALGYVIKPKGSVYFSSSKGRDTTARNLMHFHGISLDDNDNGGLPPYPLVSEMDPDELEYCSRWLDFYQFGNSENGVDGVGEIIGYLKEFRQQQESGKTDFKLPEKPKLLAD